MVNFFSIPQSRLGDMASLPVPNCLSLVLYGADGEVGGVGGECEWGVGPRVVKEGGLSQSLFDGLE